MKKLVILAALGVAGLMSAKNSDVKETKENVSKVESELDLQVKSYYYPIKLLSSCGYIEYIEFTPGFDQPDCWMVDLQQMEDECASPFYNPLPA